MYNGNSYRTYTFIMIVCVVLFKLMLHLLNALKLTCTVMQLCMYLSSRIKGALHNSTSVAPYD